MKKILTSLFIALMGITLIMSSCKKDGTSKENAFTLHETKHPTTHGYKILFGATEDTSFHYVLLCSENLEFNTNDEFTGYGDVLVLGFLSPSPTDLLPGNYIYGDNMEGFVLISYDADIDDGIEYELDDVASSTVKVNTSGSEFEFDYSLTLYTGKVLKGYYKGSLEEISLPVTKSTKSGLIERLKEQKLVL